MGKFKNLFGTRKKILKERDERNDTFFAFSRYCNLTCLKILLLYHRIIRLSNDCFDENKS